MMRKNPIDTLEIALMADGVAPKDLYPLDLDRAFRKLDEIKDHIAVWWTGGAQSTQLLESGEVDMIAREIFNIPEISPAFGRIFTSVFIIG